MKLSLKAKTLIFSGLSLLLIAGFFFIGYTIGFEKGLDSTKHPKGDGLHFYNTLPSDDYSKITYHSTLDCLIIPSGIVKDEYGYFIETNSIPPYTLRPYDFCPLCMDNTLIEVCEDKIIDRYNSIVSNLSHQQKEADN